MSRIPRLQTALLAAAGLAFAGAAFAQSQGAPGQPAQPVAAQPRPASQATSQATTPAAGVRAEPVPPQVDAAFKAFDTDHNGSLTLAEFRAGWTRLRQGDVRNVGARLQQQFQAVDANDNGGIDRTEYPNLVLVKRAGSAAPPFSEFDRDGSQKLEYAEYTALVQRLGARRPAAATPDK